jgi:hypothetical protein
MILATVVFVALLAALYRAGMENERPRFWFEQPHHRVNYGD